MIFTSFVFALLVAFSRCAAESGSDEEIPFVVASPVQPEIGGEVPPLSFQSAPSVDSRGRSDIEIEEETPFGGYFYPRPGKSFELPAFKTLDAEASFAPEVKERTARAALRPLRPPRPPRYPYHRPIRPLPAPYIPHVY